MPNQLDQVFRALSDPTRRAMVARLTRGPLTVSALAQPVPMALPSVMQHLQVLEDCGVITTRKVGRVRTCSLAGDPLRLAESWLGEQRTAWDRRLDRLEDVLGTPADTTTDTREEDR